MSKASGEMSKDEIEQDIRRILKIETKKHDQDSQLNRSPFKDKRSFDGSSPRTVSAKKIEESKSKQRYKSPSTKERSGLDISNNRIGLSPTSGKYRTKYGKINSSPRDSDCSVSPCIHLNNSLYRDNFTNESSSSAGSSSGLKHLSHRSGVRVRENHFYETRHRSESETTDAVDHELHDTGDLESNRKDKRKKKKRKKEKRQAKDVGESTFKSKLETQDLNDFTKNSKSLPMEIKSTAISNMDRNIGLLERPGCSQLSPSKHQGQNFISNTRYLEIRGNDQFEEPKCSPEEREQLEKEFIFPLKKRFSKFPKANFYCRLCDYHCDNVIVCKRHIKDSRHQKNKRNKELDITLNSLPSPCNFHIETITKLLFNIEEEYGLSEQEMETRRNVVASLNHKIKEKFTGCKLNLYGSSINQFGLKSSDVNIDLIVHDKGNPAKVLMTVYEILKENSDLENVCNDFRAKIPAIYFDDKSTKLHCIISLNNSTAQKTTTLLSDYAGIDPRVRTLGIAFRYWAKLCLIDQQHSGTLPSYSFALMLIYFLQQQKPPVLPVLHELKKGDENEYLNPKELDNLWKGQNDKSIGELWVELFKFYSIKIKLSDVVISIRQQKTLPRGEKNWSGKKIALEDPFAPKRNLARTISNLILFDYILERFKMTYKYFGIPRTRFGPLFDKLLNSKIDTSLEVRRLKSNDLLHEVVDSLSLAKTNRDSLDTEPLYSKFNEDMSKSKNTSKERQRKLFDDDTLTITIRAADTSITPLIDYPGNSESKISKNQKNCSVKQETTSFEKSLSAKNNQKINCSPQVMHIKEKDMNEFLTLDCKSRDDADSELSGSTPHEVDDDSDQENYIPASLMEALDDVEGNSLILESASECPSRQNSKNSEDINEVLYYTDNETNSSQAEAEHDNEQKNSDKTYFALSVDDDVESLTEEFHQEVQISSDESKTEIKLGREIKHLQSDEEKVTKCSSRKKDEKPSLPPELQSRLNSMKKEDFYYIFSQALFTDGKVPAKICAVCQKEGHVKQNCPEEKLPELKPLPPIRKEFMRILTTICKNIFDKHNPTEDKVKERKDILNDLLEFIKQNFDINAHLELFGSSCNGFGFSNSDLDICLTFTNNKTGEGLKCVKIIENLAEKLKRHKELYNVIAITTAKVPIVKFTHRRSSLEGDISLYNTLAQHNTRMLHLYSEIDERVKILGYTMKHFAKKCDIGDASRGSLSSYAYILMVIYYLQQRKPPVVPVLQELCEKGQPRPERIVDNCNAWFYEDKSNVQNVWPEYGKNKESVGELWLGLFRFYTEEFNFQELVISIRQHKPLTRFEKLWNSKCIAIEDPFDLEHNLGAGVSRKMNSYIMKAFIKGRHTFGHPPEDLNINIVKLEIELFHPENLTDGAPPNDRGCRICGKIGHLMKDCPRRQSNKERPKLGKDQNKDFRMKKLERGRTQKSTNNPGRPLIRTPDVLPVVNHSPQVNKMNSLCKDRKGNSGIQPIPHSFPMNFYPHPRPTLYPYSMQMNNSSNGPSEKQPVNHIECSENIHQNKMLPLNQQLTSSPLSFNKNGKLETIVVSNSSLLNSSAPVNTLPNSSINFQSSPKSCTKSNPQVQYSNNSSVIPNSNIHVQTSSKTPQHSQEKVLNVGIPRNVAAEITSNLQKLRDEENSKKVLSRQIKRLQMPNQINFQNTTLINLPMPLSEERFDNPEKIMQCSVENNSSIAKSQPSSHMASTSNAVYFPQHPDNNVMPVSTYPFAYAQKQISSDGQIHLQHLSDQQQQQQQRHLSPYPLAHVRNIHPVYVPPVKFPTNENGNLIITSSSGQPQNFGGNVPPPFSAGPQQYSQRFPLPAYCHPLVPPMLAGNQILNSAFQSQQKQQQQQSSPSSPPLSVLSQSKMIQSSKNHISQSQAHSSRTYAEMASSPGFRSLGNSAPSSHNSGLEGSNSLMAINSDQLQAREKFRDFSAENA